MLVPFKGAPCAQCADFEGRANDFQRCAPGECTFFKLIIIATYIIMRVHGELPGCTFLREVHPVGAPNKTVISVTGIMCYKNRSDKTDKVIKQCKSLKITGHGLQLGEYLQDW